MNMNGYRVAVAVAIAEQDLAACLADVAGMGFGLDMEAVDTASGAPMRVAEGLVDEAQRLALLALLARNAYPIRWIIGDAEAWLVLSDWLGGTSAGAGYTAPLVAHVLGITQAPLPAAASGGHG
ncbi:MAG: hypothetical protein NT029_08265 [Armatimonadetes bacterium]|nr:hypothetical protein [Armatimonadota bacterium]